MLARPLGEEFSFLRRWVGKQKQTVIPQVIEDGTQRVLPRRGFFFKTRDLWIQKGIDRSFRFACLGLGSRNEMESLVFFSAGLVP